MSYPKGMIFNKWLVVTELQNGVRRYAIRRWIRLPGKNKNLERLPVKRYKSLREDFRLLEEFCTRLNAEEFKIDEGRKKVEIKHAYISPALRDEYKDYLLAQIPSRSRALTEFSYLERHFLQFFIATQNMPDPVQWFKVHETTWANYLLSEKAPAASTTKQEVVFAANRFMAWLHKRRPEEVPLLTFKPLSSARLKLVKAERERKGENRETRMLKHKDWRAIRKQAPKNIWPLILLGYYFGLRRSEALGLAVTDVKKGYLAIERQLVSLPDKKPKHSTLKGRESRKVPYWILKPKFTQRLITQIELMHPDTLSDRFEELMKKLKLKYTFHDLRHTWITKMLRRHGSRDVQLAVGHKDITTTMKYAKDHRNFDDEVFGSDEVA